MSNKRLIDGDELLEWVATRVSVLEEAVKNHTGYHLRHLTGQHSSLIDLEWEIQEGRFDVHIGEGIKPETLEKIGRRVAEIRAEQAEGEAARLREALTELYLQIGQDMDINPSAKGVYLSKIGYVTEALSSHTAESEVQKCEECCGWGEIHWDDSFGFPQATTCTKCNGSGITDGGKADE